MRRRKGYYSISIVAKMLDVHQQTIRQYEKEGLISPKRTEGGTRLFSEEDVDRLEQICHITHKMGVNIAGVEMILKLQRKIKTLQTQMNKLFEQTNDQLNEDSSVLKDDAKMQMKRLVKMKKDATGSGKLLLEENFTHSQDDENEIQDTDSADDWKIDYEE